MGNFLACFAKPEKDKRRMKLAPERQVANEGYELLGQRRANATDTDAISASRYESPQLILNSPKKKVKFDLNVQAYKPTHSCEELETPLDATELKVDEEEKKDEEYITTPRAYPLNHRYQNCTGCNYDDDEDIGDDDNDDDDGEDEVYDNKEDEEPQGCDFDDDDNDGGGDGGGDEDNDNVEQINEEKEEESYESYFSLIMDKEKDQQVLTEVNSPHTSSFFPSPGENIAAIHQTILDRKNIVQSVMNPVDHSMIQGKVKACAVNHPRKENMDVQEQLEMPTISKPNIMLQKHPKSSSATNTPTPNEPSPNDEVFSVDTSLSSWLTPPKRIPTSTTSPGINSSYRSKSSAASLDERPILGALTVEDLKKQSPSPSPRKSPRKSPDEMPILGTVGSYWSHTNQEVDSRFCRCDRPVVVKGIPNTTSKYKEDKRVNWHSTPFVERLEKELKDGSATVS